MTAPAPVPVPSARAILTATGLRKTFGQTLALDHASISLAPGEIVAVMGPSGSGKSTLLHCLAGILRPDQGSVIYQGQDLTTLRDAARSTLRRTQFGFIFQFGQLVPELTCLENVALPLRMERVPRAEANRRATEELQRLAVEDVAGQRPGEISGGQGQRVAVARALVTRPRVIFADEPTGALDSLNGELVLRQLTATARETRASILLVTHEARVAAYSDREIVVRDGRTRDPLTAGAAA
ncbi:MAG: ABC transporter ATP-binding protein [Micromonosporaceae bacterium]|nr:ABC transporter ATP-binding protein [Micromonosporaceae bacterium]